MKLDIVTWPDEVLEGKAESVEITPELEELIEDMIETMYESDGVGLAAPQVGRSVRLICVDQTGPKERAELRVYINPEIVERGEEMVESEEGCLSCPDLAVKVDRHERVKVKALDREGNEVCVDAEGFLAIVLQHEIDHLDGVTLADRLGRLKKGLYKKKAMKWKK